VPACEAFAPPYFTADLDALDSGRAGITEDEKMLSQEFGKRRALRLASYMLANERARRFHNGLASGMAKEESYNLIKGKLIAFGIASESIDLDLWRRDTEKKCREDPRRKQVNQSP
jgi:hypothetical protein